MTAYYNENDKYAAQWLRNLISAGHIAPGDVDERSIEDVRPGDIAGYTQCHFFAGIGVWSYALRRAGWPDDRRVWTGSCPCQPFSAAGKGGGMADERHLWPAWFHLIAALRPERIYGEQVASKDGLAWLDLVLSDVEGADYTGRAFDLCAAGVGAPHIRQRLYWMADSSSTRLEIEREQSTREERATVERGCAVDIVEYPASNGRQQRRPESIGWSAIGGRGVGELADPDGWHTGTEWQQRGGEQRQQQAHGDARIVADAIKRPDFGSITQSGQRTIQASNGSSDASALADDDDDDDDDRRGPLGGFWCTAEWIACRDGKARPVEPGTFPLAHGATARVGRLRGYGNAIVAPLAEEFIRTTM